jgi:hypothetical protein
VKSSASSTSVTRHEHASRSTVAPLARSAASPGASFAAARRAALVHQAENRRTLTHTT